MRVNSSLATFTAGDFDLYLLAQTWSPSETRLQTLLPLGRFRAAPSKHESAWTSLLRSAAKIRRGELYPESRRWISCDTVDGRCSVGGVADLSANHLALHGLWPSFTAKRNGV